MLKRLEKEWKIDVSEKKIVKEYKIQQLRKCMLYTKHHTLC